jgi:threonyl-tRNA synthetase
MKKIIDLKSSITKVIYSKEDAINIFKENAESYKESIIQESDQVDNFQLYYQNEMNLLIYVEDLIYQA